MDYSITFSFLSIFMILTIAIACLRLSRVMWARIILQSTDTPIWRIFRYDSKCSLTSFKRRKKKCISKLEKRKHLFGALQITSTHSHAHSSSLFSHSQKKRNTRRAYYSVLFLKTTSGISVATYVTRYYKFRYFIRTIYISVSSILSYSPVLSFTLAFSISTRSIYLSTISLLYILPPAIQCFTVFTLCTFLSVGLWRKRVGCALIQFKKILDFAKHSRRKISMHCLLESKQTWRQRVIIFEQRKQQFTDV